MTIIFILHFFIVLLRENKYEYCNYCEILIYEMMDFEVMNTGSTTIYTD